MQISETTCLWYGPFHSQSIRVILVRDTHPRTRDGDDRGYGLPLITTDLHSPAEDLIARNRTRRAVERTVPFGLVCLSLTICWYATSGHSPADTADRRARSRWYTTKTEPSFEDMVIKLRRVIIAERFRPQAPYQATPEETQAVLAAWAAAET